MGLRYIEIIVDGPFDAVKGFVLGFLETIGEKSDALFAREHRIEHEGGFDHLLRLINLKEDRYGQAGENGRHLFGDASEHSRPV